MDSTKRLTRRGQAPLTAALAERPGQSVAAAAKVSGQETQRRSRRCRRPAGAEWSAGKRRRMQAVLAARESRRHRRVVGRWPLAELRSAARENRGPGQEGRCGVSPLEGVAPHAVGEGGRLSPAKETHNVTNTETAIILEFETNRRFDGSKKLNKRFFILPSSGFLEKKEDHLQKMNSPHRLTSFLAWILIANASINAQADKGLWIDFESPTFELGNIHGQHGWRVEQGRAEVSSETSLSGERSLKLWAGEPFSQAKLSLDAPATPSTVGFLDFWVKPVAGPLDETGEMLDIDGARIGLFRSETDPSKGEFWFYDEAKEEGGWVKSGASVHVDSASGAATSWVRLTIREDFARQSWDVWVAGRLSGANLGFSEQQVRFTGNYILMGDALKEIFLDDLVFSLNNPLGKDSDGDGILDEAELALGGDPAFDDRDQEKDGVSYIERYLLSETNGAGVSGQTRTEAPAAPQFSQASGMKDEVFTLVLSAKDSPENGRIFFTLDGGDPRQGKSGEVYEYTSPLKVDQTCVIRAVVADEEGKMSEVATSAWVFPSQVGSQTRPDQVPEKLNDQWIFEMRKSGDFLPIGMRGNPAEADSWEAALKSAPIVVLAGGWNQWFGPAGAYESATTIGREARVPVSVVVLGLSGGVLEAPQAVAGLSGDSSRSHQVTLKHSFRLAFPANQPLKGSQLFEDAAVPASPQLLLRHPTHDSWTTRSSSFDRSAAHYFNDELAASALRESGHTSLSRRWVHVFLNGLYWGIYEAVEQHSPSEVQSLLADGGLRGTQAIFGSDQKWFALLGAAQRLKSLLPSPSSESEWKALRSQIEEDGLIDLMLVNLWMANADWFNRNYLIVEKSGRFSFLPWDAELALSPAVEAASVDLSPAFGAGSGPAALFSALCASGEFRAKLRDRMVSVLADNGTLGQAAWLARLGRSAAALEKMLPAEAARWGRWQDPQLDHIAAWKEEVERLASGGWLTHRSSSVAAQVEAALSAVEHRQRAFAEAEATKASLLPVERYQDVDPPVEGEANKNNEAGQNLVVWNADKQENVVFTPMEDPIIREGEVVDTERAAALGLIPRVEPSDSVESK